MDIAFCDETLQMENYGEIVVNMALSKRRGGGQLLRQTYGKDPYRDPYMEVLFELSNFFNEKWVKTFV